MKGGARSVTVGCFSVGCVQVRRVEFKPAAASCLARSSGRCIWRHDPTTWSEMTEAHVTTASLIGTTASLFSNPLIEDDVAGCVNDGKSTEENRQSSSRPKVRRRRRTRG
jgi:hypothetical protein